MMKEWRSGPAEYRGLVPKRTDRKRKRSGVTWCARSTLVSPRAKRNHTKREDSLRWRCGDSGNLLAAYMKTWRNSGLTLVIFFSTCIRTSILFAVDEFW